MEVNLAETFGTYMSWKLNENTWIINFMGGTQNIWLLILLSLQFVFLVKIPFRLNADFF